jgi:hypothetical protein
LHYENFIWNPRPFWINGDLYKYCDMGFGNPSGHSFTSTAAYLSIWNVITDYDIFNKDLKGKIIRIILLIFFILLIISIMISRVYLALHSVNQILYGSLLGLGFYLIVFHIIEINKMKGVCFFKFIRLYLFWAFWFIFIISFALFIWGFLIKSENLTSNWFINIEKKCKEIKPYRLFNNDGLYGALTIFAILGSHFGLIILAKKTDFYFNNKEDEILNWYKSSNLKNHLLRIGFDLINLFPLIVFF